MLYIPHYKSSFLYHTTWYTPYFICLSRVHCFLYRRYPCILKYRCTHEVHTYVLRLLTAIIGVLVVELKASIQEAKRLLATFEAEQSDRQAYRARPLKFESGRMQPQDEQKIKPIGYVAELG